MSFPANCRFSFDAASLNERLESHSRAVSRFRSTSPLRYHASSAIAALPLNHIRFATDDLRSLSRSGTHAASTLTGRFDAKEDTVDLGHDLSQAIAHAADYAGELSFGRRRYTRDLAGVDIAVVG